MRCNVNCSGLFAIPVVSGSIMADDTPVSSLTVEASATILLSDQGTLGLLSKPLAGSILFCLNDCWEWSTLQIVVPRCQCSAHRGLRNFPRGSRTWGVYSHTPCHDIIHAFSERSQAKAIHGSYNYKNPLCDSCTRSRKRARA
jgi:hypothetical protein